MRKLMVGDWVLVRPGEKVPADGIVVAGLSWCDEAMLSGESRPVHKTVGAAVVAGSINVDGSLTVEVRSTGADTALAHIVALVEEAQGSKPKVQRVADRIVPWFVAATLGLALVTFAYWFDADMDKAMLAAVSVLIITCPCALGLATPMGIAVGVGAGASLGVLVRQGQALERLSDITHIVFDKTGTLTEGYMRVVACRAEPGFEREEVLVLAAAVERHSMHPLAQAICRTLEESDSPLPGCEDFLAHTGQGVSGRVGEHRLLIGNLAMMRGHGVEVGEALLEARQAIESGMGVGVIVAIDGRAAGILHLQDRLRPEAQSLITALKGRGIGISMLTGDSWAAARALADSFGGIGVVAECSPADKEAEVRRLQQAGESVLMIGDGVNDAPALARADVSMAMGSGMDVSKASADIVLVASDLSRVGFAMHLARTTLSTIRRNIAISLAYNLVLVPMAMAAMVTPLFAAVAMPVSSMLVIGNALMIRRRVRVKNSCGADAGRSMAVAAG